MRLLTDTATGASTAITDTYDYDAYGQLLACEASSGGQLVTVPPNSPLLTPNSYRFTGEQWDSDLNMYYLRARYLSPNTGRFWTMDSYEGGSAEPLSLHKYLYAADDPVNRIDPSGNDSLIGLSIAGGIAVGIEAMYNEVVIGSGMMVMGMVEQLDMLLASVVVDAELSGASLDTHAFGSVFSYVDWDSLDNSDFEWNDDYEKEFLESSEVERNPLIMSVVPIRVKLEGDRRERRAFSILKQEYPKREGYSIQRQVHVRNSRGFIIGSGPSGRRGGRILDFVVVKNDKVVKVIEATSKTADKSGQLGWEAAKQMKRTGYVRNRISGRVMKLPTAGKGVLHWSNVRRYR